MARWYAGMVIYRVTEEGEREYLVINTRSVLEKYKGRPMQTKFCGGTEENHELDDRTIIDTFHRELEEETGMRLRKGVYPYLIYTESPKDGHFKNFYEVNFDDLVGELRTEEKTVEGDWMSPPYWLSYDALTRVLFPTHVDALVKSENRFKMKRLSA